MTGARELVVLGSNSQKPVWSARGTERANSYLEILCIVLMDWMLRQRHGRYVSGRPYKTVLIEFKTRPKERTAKTSANP